MTNIGKNLEKKRPDPESIEIYNKDYSVGLDNVAPIDIEGNPPWN
jgi:hypothetical protein